jgi:hypothetical protein
MKWQGPEAPCLFFVGAAVTEQPVRSTPYAGTTEYQESTADKSNLTAQHIPS